MTRNHLPGTMHGEALIALLQQQIDQHDGGLQTALAPFDAEAAVTVWMETLRAVEEFINLPLFGLDDEVIKAALIALPVNATNSRPRRLRAVRHHVSYRYGEAFARRFSTLLLQGTAIGHAFAQHGIASGAAGFVSVGTMVGYLQSRRRHLVSLLYTLPMACRGDRTVVPIDTLNQFLPLVELNGVTLTGLYQQLMLTMADPDYSVELDAHGFQGSQEYPALDYLFLEPERASIVEMHAASPSPAAFATLEPVPQDRLFSAAELRNDIRHVEAAFAEFDLAGSDFNQAAMFVRRLSELAKDEYWISVPFAQFDALADECSLSATLKRALVHRGDTYVANTNSYAPFVTVSGELRTTVTLLSRFLYYWKNVCLYKIRRFQIRSGFIFEQTIATALARQRFTLTGIKRLNRKEFDVVAVRDGVIFNIQCKNNLVDLSRLEADVALFVRYNRARVRSYERALRKEVDREALLTAELGIAQIEHFVVTRFPVASTNPRIIVFSRFDDFDNIASSLIGPASDAVY
jgi:hypothetical protein